MEKKWLYVSFIFIIALNLIILFIYNREPFFSALASFGRVFIQIIGGEFVIAIISPENKTYHFENWQSFTIDLNVSSSIAVEMWVYTLIRTCDNFVVKDNVAFTPNTTITAVRKSNQLNVNATSTDSRTANKSVTFFVDVNNSAPLIQNITSPLLVCEDSYLSYYFNVIDVDCDCVSNCISLSLVPTNPFYTAWIYQAGNLTRGEIFSGILTKNRVGNYSEIIYASDGEYSDFRQFNVSVIEINNKPSVAQVGAQTVWVNETFYYQIVATDTEDGSSSGGNLKFNLTFLSGNKFFDINFSYGIMNVTPNISHLGVYNLSVCVEDRGITNIHPNISICGQNGRNLTTCVNWSLTVTNANRAPNITSWWPLNLTQIINQSESIYFNITKYDPDGTIPDTYWYIDNVLIANFIDNITYIFNTVGYHNLTARVTDGELNASITWNITVNALPPGVVVGGGGAAGVILCTEKWVCDEWKECQNLNFSYKQGLVDYKTKEIIENTCKLNALDSEKCGFQLRDCLDINNCSTTKNKPIIIQACYFTPEPSCKDKIKNCHRGSCEILIDCGGPCLPCPTCSDSIQNQGEKGIDCEGPCPQTCPVEKPLIPPKPKALLYFLLILILLILVFIIILIIIIKRTKKKINEEKI